MPFLDSDIRLITPSRLVVYVSHFESIFSFSIWQSSTFLLVGIVILFCRVEPPVLLTKSKLL